MARLIPTFQMFVDDRTGATYLITKVVPQTKKDFVSLPRQSGAFSTMLMSYPVTAAGVASNNTPRDQSGDIAATGNCVFYVSATGDAQIINGSVGQEYTIVSRHQGQINYASTTAARVA